MQCVRNAKKGLKAGNLCHSISLYPLIPEMCWSLHSFLVHCRRISAGRKTCAVHSALLPSGRGRSSHLLSVQSNVVPQGPRQGTYLTSELLSSWKLITAFCTSSLPLLPSSLCIVLLACFLLFTGYHVHKSIFLLLKTQHVCRFPCSSLSWQ